MRLLGQLRVATHRAHQTLEQHPLLLPLTSLAMTGDEYRRVLIAFADFYRLLEPALLDDLTHLADAQGNAYRYQPRWPLLQDDLRDLGTVTDTAPSVTTVLPSTDDTGSLLGVLYVLEGATQGGRVIAPCLAGTLCLDAERGARYFHLYKQGTWQHFKALLAHYDEVLDDRAVTPSAVQVFDALYQHLDHYLPPDGMEP